jgi:hypothetical protein
LGNPIDLRADKALPRKSGRRPLVGRRRVRGGDFSGIFSVTPFFSGVSNWIRNNSCDGAFAHLETQN